MSERSWLGVSQHGSPVLVNNSFLGEFPKSFRALNLLDALYELFPELSKSETRRLIEGRALRGWFADKVNPKDILDDTDDTHIEERTNGLSFVIIQLGKREHNIPRWGIIALRKDLRDAMKEGLYGF